ncbi:uncharacterized protein K452DRAFT_92514 [Aplosporella prunicola CBS 121167]|uniref:Uncharacterized protein n=1 Tax=Aplosporella prunicola CBS 121167 TaxID=1176127 RepID=A0A6A6B2S5_9PEZI|nr:uncharacterized protein K452DRAFT_92514 [Aplosporella prunicola CBS 121167]KAF2138350.1 hypothetical protein K452DRAFT_92514 [Aplosporella prunicola CBS 121167]
MYLPMQRSHRFRFARAAGSLFRRYRLSVMYICMFSLSFSLSLSSPPSLSNRQLYTQPNPNSKTHQTKPNQSQTNPTLCKPKKKKKKKKKKGHRIPQSKSLTHQPNHTQTQSRPRTLINIAIITHTLPTPKENQGDSTTPPSTASHSNCVERPSSFNGGGLCFCICGR